MNQLKLPSFRTESLFRSLLMISLLMMSGAGAFALPKTRIGPYQVELTTQPGVVPSIGRAKLYFKITDASGKPMDGVTVQSLTQMPGMNMGEREETAAPVPDKPGVYTAPAQFAMEGSYDNTLRIEGPQGAATGKIKIATGQNTTTALGSGATGGPFQTAFWPVLIVALLALVVVRMRKTGQSVSVRGLAHRSVIGGLILLGVILWAAVYAVGHWRRPGAFTPIEVQGMEMNLPAPLGTAPVELATVESGAIDNTVRYPGQAVGYVEQEITARTTGVITWMPFYAGDRVRRGQLLARLDTSQSAPFAAAQKGQVAVMQEGVAVARKDYEQALALVHEAHAEVGMKTGADASARADIAAAQQERASMQAGLEAAQSMTPDATAQLQAAQADAGYWREEIAREATLLKAGAVTREEYQREKSQAEAADSKVQQAQARIVQVQAQIRAAQAGVDKADAMIASAKAKSAEAQSDLQSHNAHVLSAQAAAASARQKIFQAEAGVQQARGALAGATAGQGYSEIRSQTDGVVTQRVLSPGVLINPGQTLLKIAQISPIRLQANVAETDLQKVRVGGRVVADNESHRPVVARITSISPSIDPVARTGIVEALVPNRDSRFLPGQYVTMDLSTGSAARTLYIPTRALRYHTTPSGKAISTVSTASVWIAEPAAGQEGQYTAHEATVRTGVSDAKNTEILAGLEAGQKVVTSGQDYLKDGDLISPVSGSADGVANSGDARQPAGQRSGAPVMAGHPSPARTLYTCLMHPEILQDHPGFCPKCHMALVKKPAGGAR